MARNLKLTHTPILQDKNLAAHSPPKFYEIKFRRVGAIRPLRRESLNFTRALQFLMD